MARRRGQSFDYVIAASVALLLIIGFAALASASSDLGKLQYDDAYYYLKHQAIYGLGFGIVGFLVGFYVDYRKFKKLVPILFFLGIGALILTFTPLGTISGGASRWIAVGPTTIQPSELLKIFFIDYRAPWLSGSPGRKKTSPEDLLLFLFISEFVALLLF